MIWKPANYQKGPASPNPFKPILPLSRLTINARISLSAWLQMAMVSKNGIGALSFGVEIGGGKVSYPTSPTWMLYTGEEARCNDDIPILIRREVFCRSYYAEARVFRMYHSWTLTMLLGQVS